MNRLINAPPEHLQESILKFARRDFPLLDQEFTVNQALDLIRKQGLGEKIIYFYVVDEQRRLAGVLPTRRLLTMAPDARLKDIMITRVVTIPDTYVGSCDHGTPGPPKTAGAPCASAVRQPLRLKQTRA